MDEEYDVCSIGHGDENRKFPVISGESDYKALLKKQFPDEESAIDRYFSLLKEVKEGSAYGILLKVSDHMVQPFHSFKHQTIHQLTMKVLPLWAAWLLVKTGVIGWFCKSYSAKFTKMSTLQHIRSLTDNKDLQTVMTYNFGNMGVDPPRCVK